MESKKTVYGINTGIGTELSSKIIPEDQVDELNINLVRSHAVGVGEALSPCLTRSLLAMQINGYALGYKGVSQGTVRKCLAALNANCLPVVPVKGTVGCHDLAQLSHLALGLMGEGKMWKRDDNGNWVIDEAAQVLKEYNLIPIIMKAGEALPCINGTNFVATLAAEAINRARILVETADVVAAMSIEGLVGTQAAFDKDIHNARPHNGQIKV